MIDQEPSAEQLKNEINQLKKQITSLQNAITKIKKTEEETLEKQARYETLFEHADDAIFFETDMEDIVDVNEGACKMFGYSREELLRMKSTQLFHSDGPSLSIYSNPALGSELPVEMTGLRKDRSTISLEYTITPLISGRNTVFMFIIRDITKRKAAEKAMQESEEKYRSILETIEDGYYEIDLAGNITFYNSSLSRMIGYSDAEVLGLNYKTFTDKENSNKLNHFFNDVFKQQQPIKGVEWELIRKDQEKRFMESSVSLKRDENGNTTGFCGILRDVTNRKQAEEELKTTQAHLMESKKMAALGELVAGVAHEINTPIGIGVTGMSTLEDRTKAIVKLYEQDDLSKEEFEQYLRTVTDASHAVLSNLHRAADLVRTFKQVAVDQSSEELRKFKFKEYLNDILTSMQPKLKKTSHQVTVNCPEDLELVSYPGAFSRIITNLIINSLVHAFEGIEKGKIVFDISVNQDYFFIQYSDNGKGISPDVLEKIFDPFFTTKRGQGGTGLGMHIVYNLVTQTLNGKIKCSSTPGNGSQFLITIPIR